ncbi:MAG: acyltransferase family protein [Xanthobacteraceae bacterium]
MALPATMSRSSLALHNLRAVVILIVLAFHSVLAYVQFIPERSAGFDKPPYMWRAFPIVDSHRWFGFDLFCAWQDVYLMSLMFLLSGLFVWPSLQRKHSFGFVRDRLRRLGVPYVFGVLVLNPIAFYPAYRALGGAPSVSAYVRDYIALPFLPNAQLWFLWQLLALNFVVVAMNRIAPAAIPALGRWCAKAGQRPAVFFAVLIAVSAVAYVPLALAFTPWAWSNSGLLSVQWCRPLLYGVYFFTGIGIGAAGLDVGLVAADGALGRHWKLWLALALATLFLWMGVTSLTLDGSAPLPIEIAADLCFVLACAGGCFFIIASSLRFGLKRSAALDSLSVNAYSLYLVHYVFTVWLQYALLGAALFALLKGVIVFCGTVILSWLTILLVERIPFGLRLVSTPSRVAAVEKVPSQSGGGLYARLRQFVSH